MAIFRAFQAYRPSEAYQSLIPDLPYDVLTSQEAKVIAGNQPYSFLHVDKAEIDLDDSIDPYSPNVYQKAKDNLDDLEHSGVLIQDDRPCFYIQQQIMNGKSQIGLVGLASVDDYCHHIIKRHEHTLSKKLEDRIHHMYACQAHTGPIFLTYQSQDELHLLIHQWMEHHPMIYEFEKYDVMYRVWKVDDPHVIQDIQKAFEKINALYIADGHHRCASAVEVALQKRKERSLSTGLEEESFLAIAFSSKDVHIMEYNRVVKAFHGDFDTFLNQVRTSFDVEIQNDVCKPSQKHHFGMYYNHQWYLLKAKESLIQNKDDLDVSLLQEYLLDPILGIHDPQNDPHIAFMGGIKGMDALMKKADETQGIAFSLYPVCIEDIMHVADEGGVMPPKSTWFEPKLLSGLFIHHFE